MKNSDSSTQNISLQIAQFNLLNKSVSLSDPVMAVSNTNTNSVVISSVMPTPIHTPQALLNTNRAVNEVKACNFIFAKGQSTSNLMSQITLNPQNNTYKLVPLSKCQAINKETNIVPNNAINLQILTSPPNTCSTTITNETTNVSKTDMLSISGGSYSNNNSNCVSSIPITNSSVNPRGRLIVQTPQSQYMAINIPTSELSKTPQVIVKGKPPTQTIRPIITQSNVSKQQFSIISPTKTLTNLSQITTVSMAENSSPDDAITIRRSQILEDQKSSKTTPVKLQNSNIRLALTRNIPNKIQVISPKSRKRSSSPVKLLQDCKMNDKDDSGSMNNSISECGNYSPTRKRARKQHFKSVPTKSQKFNAKLPSRTTLENITTNLNTIRPAISEKPSTITNKLPISAKPQEESKVSSNLSSSIVIELKNSNLTNSTSNNSNNINTINKSCANIIQRPTSIYSNNQVAQLISVQNNNNISSTTSTSVQIITPNSSSSLSKQIQLSPQLLPHKQLNKNQTINNSPTKIYHISQCSNINSRITMIKNEPLSSNLCNSNNNYNNTFNSSNSQSLINTTIKEIGQISNLSQTTKALKNKNHVIDVQNKIKKLSKTNLPLSLKSEFGDIKSECSDDLSSYKYSIYPHKYNWNSRKYHFEKKGDVKIRKIRSTQKNSNYSSNNFDKDTSGSDIEVSDTRWFLHKASDQVRLQKKFDTENYEKFQEIKRKFDDSGGEDDSNEMIFKSICSDLCNNFSKVSDSSIDIIHEYENDIQIKSHLDPSYFGITDDLIHSYTNTLPKQSSPSNDINNSTSNNNNCKSNSHTCSSSCIYYFTEEPRSQHSPEKMRILDLLEGLIVKESRLIEKEEEIYNQCQTLLSTSKSYYDDAKCDPDISIDTNKPNNNSKRR